VKDAAEYLAQVKALIVMNPEIVHWTALREEAQGDVGFIRYKHITKSQPNAKISRASQMLVVCDML